MFQRKSLGVLALSIGLGLSASAGAVVTAPTSFSQIGNDITAGYGNITAPESYLSSFHHGLLPTPYFTDLLTFSITGPIFSEGALSNVKLFNLRNITGLSVSLYYKPAGPGIYTFVDNLDDNPGSTTDQKVGSGSYALGDYYFKVSGKAAGTDGGDYTFQAVTSVPEADTSAMLMVGLGMVGFMARRRMVRDV